MKPEKRIGITLPAGPEVKNSIEQIQWAEQNGFQDAWLSDGTAPDSLTLCGVLAGYTKTIRVGVAVTPVYTRTPAVIAATANCLGQVLPGRFILGLGSSSQTMMEGWHGQQMKLPLTRVKETVTLVRSMLSGEKSDFNLKTLSSKGYRQVPMKEPPPIYLAALRPKMIDMATRHGDGVIFNLWPKSALPKMIEQVKASASDAGKNLADVEIVNRFMVCVTDDLETARNRFRVAFAPYYATPVYNNFLAWAGFEDVAATIAEGWRTKDRAKTMGALSDDLIDQIAILGSADHCRDRIREAAEGGIDVHVIAPQTANMDEFRVTYDAFTADNFSF